MISREQLRALAASTLCVGYAGDPADVPAALDALPAGIVLFATNIGTREETAGRIAALRAQYPPELPPLVAVDQEGGRVARIRAGAVEIPAMMAVGATRAPALAERAGAQMGRDLRRYGINVDFAPVLDLALEPLNTVIGARSFGTDPALASALGIALANGLRASGVAAVPKHAPGHGATETDSHLALPTIVVDRNTLMVRDLAPFAAACAAGVPALMLAHIVVACIDPDRPASLSPLVIGDLLRTELGFDGVLFTDALEMKALASSYSAADASVAALAAGIDCLLPCEGLEQARAVLEAITAALENGSLPLERVKEASARVGHMRAALAVAPDPGPDDLEIGREIARRAVTVLRGDVRLAGELPVTVVSFEGATAEGAQGRLEVQGSLNAALRLRRRRCEIMRVALDPDADDIELLRAHLRSPAPRCVVVVVRRAALSRAQRTAVEAVLADVPEATVVCAREPFDAACFPQARTLVCIYGDERTSFEGLADAMVGRSVPAGVLPVPLAERPVHS